jgi:hypothetical protein
MTNIPRRWRARAGAPVTENPFAAGDHAPVVEPVVAAVPAAAAPPAPATEPEGSPTWNATMKKAELFMIAVSLGLPVEATFTKAMVLAVLDASKP